MPFLLALLLARPAPAMNALKARRRADTALVCQQILARGQFELDDAVAHGLAEPLAANVYRIVGSEIDPLEVSALVRLVRVKGGRALAIGTLGSQADVPLVDAIHYADDGARQLLSIKTTVRSRTDGIRFVRSQLFRRKRAARRLLSREGLADLYHVDDRPPVTVPEFNRAFVETILRLWDLQRVPQPRVTFLLDLAPASHLSPTLRRAVEVFPDSLRPRTRPEDRVMLISHGGKLPDGLPCVFNMDSFMRDLMTDQQFAGAIILFNDHFCEVNQDGLDLRPLPHCQIDSAAR